MTASTRQTAPADGGGPTGDDRTVGSGPPPVTIRRRTRRDRAAGFEALRQRGIGLLQTGSGTLWTDHNLHDPGITILEQLCFALTELAYHAEQPLADHLTGPDGRIGFEALSLHPPAAVFPCRATTADDMRRALLDGVAGLDDAHLQPHPAGPPGLNRLLLKLSSHTGRSPAQRVQDALAVVRAQRGLCEDVDPQVVPVADLRCELVGEVEITGAREPDELLADIFHTVASRIDHSAQLHSRHTLQARGWLPEEIYDGPVVTHGFADRHAQAAGDTAQLYLADLVQAVAGVAGVKEVHRLALQIGPTLHEHGTVPWVVGDAALRLQVPGAADDPAPLRLQLRRRQHAVPGVPAELWRRVQNLQAAAQSQRFRLAASTRQDEQQALPRGQHRPAMPYHSVQHHFPALYGLGRHGVPSRAGALALARARQLRSYLLLFEQQLANGQAQLQHLRELLSPASLPQQGAWWLPLGEEQVPGLEGVCRLGPDALLRDVLRPFDGGTERLHQRLDHLLALHGESFSQNAVRLFCGHLDADQLEERLLANKTAYLHDIVSLSRHRAGGFDDSKALWNNPSNTPGLARRASLLLGFARDDARSLTARQSAIGLGLSEDAEPGTPPWSADIDDPAACDGADRQALPPGTDERHAILRSLLPRKGGRLAGALLRAGASIDSYRLVPEAPQTTAAAAPGGRAAAAASPAGGGGCWLAVGPDEQGRWWPLRRYDHADAARRAAATLHSFLLARNDEAEGLHLVEHLLLRPTGAAPAPAAATSAAPAVSDGDAGFYALRLTAVLPGWTVRTRQPAFRRLAEDTLKLNTPVHLWLGVRWLDFDAMADFEADYGRWLDRRQRWLQPGGTADAALGADLDAAAAAVRGWLVGAPRGSPAPAPARPAPRHAPGAGHG